MRLPTSGRILQYRFRSSFTSQHFDIKRYDIYIATAAHVEYKPHPYDAIDISIYREKMTVLAGKSTNARSPGSSAVYEAKDIRQHTPTCISAERELYKEFACILFSSLHTIYYKYINRICIVKHISEYVNKI